MSSISLLVKNLLETGTVTATAAASGFPITRAYDRDRGLQVKAAAAGAFDVDIVMGGDTAASALALVNHNAAAGLEVYADTASAIGTTLIATLAPTGLDPFYATFTAQAKTKYRLRFLAFGSALQVGEILLGPPNVVALTPGVGTPLRRAGLVKRYVSPGGHPWTARRGPVRWGGDFTWDALLDAELAVLLNAFAESGESAKAHVLVDWAGTVRWGEFLEAMFEWTPLGSGLHRARVRWQEIAA